MGIDYICPMCGKRYDLAENLAGKRARCKPCGSEFRVPVPASGPYSRDDFDPYAIVEEPPRPSRSEEDDDFAPPPRRLPRKKKTRPAQRERNEGLLGWGIWLMILGGGAFVLPIFGLQWSILHLLDANAQMGLGFVMLVIGALCVVCSGANALYSLLGFGMLGVTGLVFVLVMAMRAHPPALHPNNRPGGAEPIQQPPRHVFPQPRAHRLPTPPQMPTPTPPPPTFASPPPPSFQPGISTVPPPPGSPPPSSSGFPSHPAAPGFPPPPQ